ncbi:MAG: PKD domain-containing protein [Moorellaceae bacterium]
MFKHRIWLIAFLILLFSFFVPGTAYAYCNYYTTTWDYWGQEYLDPYGTMIFPYIFVDMSGPLYVHYGQLASYTYHYATDCTIIETWLVPHYTCSETTTYCQECIDFDFGWGAWSYCYSYEYPGIPYCMEDYEMPRTEMYGTAGYGTTNQSILWQQVGGYANFMYDFRNGECYDYGALGGGVCSHTMVIPSYLPEGQYYVFFGGNVNCNNSFWWFPNSDNSASSVVLYKYITIYNTAPSVSLYADPQGSVPVNQTVNFSAVASDPDGDPVNTYEWTVPGRGTFVSGSPGITASWSSPGSYTVSVRAQDAYGKWSAPASITVSVTANRPPVAALKISTPPPIYVGSAVTADGTGSYDPDAGDTIATAMWYYRKPGGNWVGPVTQKVQGPSGLTWTLTPDTSGQWDMQLVVQDSRGAASAPAYATFNVLDVPPPITNGGGSCYTTTTTPTIGWVFSQPQSAYQVVIRSSNGNTVYDTGKVISSQTSFTIPSGVLWASGDYRFTVQVRAWNSAGYASGWSAPAGFCVTAFERPRVVEIIDPPPGQTAPSPSSPIVITPGTRASGLPRAKAGSRVGVEIDSIGIGSLTSVAFPYLDRTATVGDGTPREVGGIGFNKTWLVEFWTDASKAVVPDGTVVGMQLNGRGLDGGTVNFGLPPYADGVIVISDTAYSDWFVILQGTSR